MDTEAMLLRAICERPDEDAPRLAFADWLTERGGPGDATWAELIRTQVALALGAGADRPRFAAREAELLAALVRTRPEPIRTPRELAWENWTRGFPHTLSGIGALIRGEYPRFAGRVPLGEFNFDAATDADLLALASWPEARLVRKLGVWTVDVPISEAAFIVLVECPALAGVERLRIEFVGLTDRAAIAFLDSPLCANLRHLKMRLAGGQTSLSADTWQRLRGRFGEYDVY